MTGYLQVSTTADSREAAGAQVTGPVVSYFWHLGQLGEGEEYQVTLKTTEARYPDLEAHLIREHPWDNPEVTAVEIAAGSAAYLEWLDRTTSAQESS